MDLGLLADIGPQRPDESLLARRVRFHQSWYRAEILGLSRYGYTSGPVPRPMGSVLTDKDAQAGRNFTCHAARRLYEHRRSEGWGVDPVRCTKYLTSSQALTLNLLGPLKESSAWFARALGVILMRTDIRDVKQFWVEFAPRRRSEYLHDSTRIDALVLMATSQGDEVLAIEVKYSDRFNSRRVDIDRPPYRDLDRSVGLWLDVDRTLLSPEVNQLVRCHALAAAVSRDIHQSAVPSLLVLHHEADTASRTVVEGYRTHLKNSALSLSTTLRDFVDVLHRTAWSDTQRENARSLQLRYVAEDKSEPAWMKSDDRHVRRCAAGHVDPASETYRGCE